MTKLICAKTGRWQPGDDILAVQFGWFWASFVATRTADQSDSVRWSLREGDVRKLRKSYVSNVSTQQLRKLRYNLPLVLIQCSLCVGYGTSDFFFLAQATT